MNAGTRTVEWLFEDQLRVDAEWSVKTPHGFRWWADKNAQTIEIVGQETGPNGETGYLLSVRTEVLRNLHLSDAVATDLNASAMPFASMGGLVYEDSTETLHLCSLVRVYDAISSWMNPLISMAAVLQISRARILTPIMAEKFNAEQALSGPPGRGLRPEPDELVDIVDELVRPLGDQPSRWAMEEFQETVDLCMQEPPALDSDTFDCGFAVAFPYSDQQSDCNVTTYSSHLYGNGIEVIQAFPFSCNSEAEGARLAFSMNKKELTEKPLGYGFGSYFYLEDELLFRSFLPNAVYRPGLLPNIYFSCAQRARGISVLLANSDWTEESFRPDP